MNKFVLTTLTLLLMTLSSGSWLKAQSPASAGQERVTGVVTDSEGRPIIGATVVVVGTTTGVVTNTGGEYAIVCSPSGTLEFSFMGYDPVSVPIGGRTRIDVTLTESQTTLDEVIVIGYGTTTRRRTVGSVDQVKADALTERSVANVTQALQGAAPGIIIQQRSMDPNDQKLNLNIRGIGTMNNNSPLIVIDGLVSDDGSLNKLNPNDIESISVLKDASTAAIYGSRSANGVLLVTTKQGKKNQAPRVNLSMTYGMQQPEYLFEKVQGYQNATLKNLALMNANKSLEFTPSQIYDLYINGNGEQFQETIMQNAAQQNYNVNIMGGGETTTYMVSAGLYDQRSNFVGPNFGIQRLNFRTNLTTEYKRLKLSALLGYTHEDNKAHAGRSLEVNTLRIPSYYYYHLKDPVTGKYLVNDVVGDINSLALLEQGGYNKYNNDYTTINTSAELKIVEGLKLKGVLGAEVIRENRSSRYNLTEAYRAEDIDGTPMIGSGKGDNASGTEDWNRLAYQINMQLYADYEKYFCRHHLTALIGGSNESFSRYDNEVNILSPDLDLGVPSGGSQALIASQRVTPQTTMKTSIISVFGRLGYDYDSRYFAEFSFRYDGASKFEKDLRWGFFPSASVGWSASQEAFMEGYRNKVGDLKVRASYGTLGNQRVDPYQYLTTYTPRPSIYSFGDVIVGGTEDAVGSDNLTWEVARTFNVGADASFFKNRLTVSFDWFNKNTTKILVRPTVPTLYGRVPKDYNAGEMRTQGWEATIGLNLKTGGFKHNILLNMGDSWNEVVKFEGFESIRQHEEIWDIIRVGLPFRSFYGYKSAGIFQTQAEADNWAQHTGTILRVQAGDLKIVDRNGDGVIDDSDRYYLGNAFPRYTFGFNYNVAWKGFDLGIFLQGVLKRDMMLRGELVEPFHENYSYTMFKHQLDYWTPTNTGAKYPRLVAAPENELNYGKGYGSDLFIFDGAYMRVKNISLGYTLPETWLKRVGIQKARIYVNAQNLFTFSNTSFVDPESSGFNNNMGGGVDYARNYPLLKYYGMGLDITF